MIVLSLTDEIPVIHDLNVSDYEVGTTLKIEISPEIDPLLRESREKVTTIFGRIVNRTIFQGEWLLPIKTSKGYSLTLEITRRGGKNSGTLRINDGRYSSGRLVRIHKIPLPPNSSSRRQLETEWQLAMTQQKDKAASNIRKQQCPETPSKYPKTEPRSQADSKSQLPVPAQKEAVSNIRERQLSEIQTLETPSKCPKTKPNEASRSPKSIPIVSEENTLSSLSGQNGWEVTTFQSDKWYLPKNFQITEWYRPKDPCNWNLPLSMIDKKKYKIRRIEIENRKIIIYFVHFSFKLFDGPNLIIKNSSNHSVTLQYKLVTENEYACMLEDLCLDEKPKLKSINLYPGERIPGCIKNNTYIVAILSDTS